MEDDRVYQEKNIRIHFIEKMIGVMEMVWSKSFGLIVCSGLLIVLMVLLRNFLWRAIAVVLRSVFCGLCVGCLLVLVARIFIPSTNFFQLILVVSGAVTVFVFLQEALIEIGP